MAATKPCPPLPFELWGKVLSNIDDPFDLWTTCRQISNGIKIEAEYTFRLRFLPDLRIKWSITRDNRYCETIYLDIRAKPSHALVDATSSSATFTIQVNGPVSSTSSGYVGWSNKERNECVRQAFHYKDHNATTRTSGQPFAIIRHKMRLFFETTNVLATYQNDPEISGLRIHLTPFRDQVSIKAWEDQGHISFDWKKLMTSFFSEEAAFRNIERYYIAAVRLARAPDRKELYVEAHRETPHEGEPKAGSSERARKRKPTKASLPRLRTCKTPARHPSVERGGLRRKVLAQRSRSSVAYHNRRWQRPHPRFGLGR